MLLFMVVIFRFDEEMLLFMVSGPIMVLLSFDECACLMMSVLVL